jgi:tetratricopeptide (TPR) repeat protein
MNLNSYYFNLENYNTVDEVMSQTQELGKNQEYGYLFRWADVAGYNSQALRGRLSSAADSLEHLIAQYDPNIPVPLELTPGGDMKIAATAWYVVFAHILGFHEKSKTMADQMLSLTQDFKDSRTLYHGYTFHALHALTSREWKVAETTLNQYLPIARKFGDPIFTLTAEVYYYIAKGFLGQREALEKAAELLSACHDVGFRAFAACLAAGVGELFFKFEEFKSALDWNNKYLDYIEKSNTKLYTAELNRINGNTLWALGKPNDEVEQYFKKSLKISKEQNAKTFELRAASDLAALWHHQGKTKEGYQVLKDVYDWFPPDTTSVDYNRAQSQLHFIDNP